MRSAHLIVAMTIVLLLLGGAIAPLHVDPLLGPIEIAFLFVLFAALSSTIGMIMRQRTGLAIVWSILLAGMTLGLRELFWGTQVATFNLIAVVAGSVWGAALAHLKKGSLL